MSSKQDETQQKTKSDLLTRLFTVGTFVICGFGLYLVCLIHHVNEQRKAQHPNYDHPEWSQLFWILPFCTIHWILKKLFSILLYKPAVQLVKWIKDPEIIEKKAQKVVICTYKLFYFICSTIFGYYLLWNENYMPPLLGFDKQNETYKQYEGYPWFSNLQPARIYIIFESTYHLFSFLDLTFFQENRADKIQMQYHHVITISLIVCSYLYNCVRTAALVLLSHAIADVGIYTIKIFVEFKSRTLIIIIWASSLAIYIWTRFLVFGKDVIYNAILMCINTPDMIGSQVFVVLLFALLSFHICGFLMLAQSGIRVIQGKHASADLQHNYYEDKKQK